MEPHIPTDSDSDPELESPSMIVSQLRFCIWIPGYALTPDLAPQWMIGHNYQPLPLERMQSHGLDETKFLKIIRRFNEITVAEYQQKVGCTYCYHSLAIFGAVAVLFSGIILIIFAFRKHWAWAFGAAALLVMAVVIYKVSVKYVTRRQKEAIQCAVDAIRVHVDDELNPNWWDSGLQWKVDIRNEDIEMAKGAVKKCINGITLIVV